MPRCSATRPTAINLKWALDEMSAAVRNRPRDERAAVALKRADEIAEEDVAINRGIGRARAQADRGDRGAQKRRARQRAHALQRRLARRRRHGAPPPRRSNAAHDKGIAMHVYADETRPRNQGASLTAWELGQHGVPHTVIPDNTGGHLMQHGLVDLVIVGADRVTRARRRLQQDRHISEGARRARQQRAVLCRAAVADHRLHGERRARRNPDRTARA